MKGVSEMAQQIKAKPDNLISLSMTQVKVARTDSGKLSSVLHTYTHIHTPNY